MSDLLECTICFPDYLEDVVSIAVTDFGIASFIIGGCTLVSGTKPAASITVYLEGDMQLDELKRFVARRINASSLGGEATYQVTAIERQTWEEAWKQYWEPIVINDSLVIAPAWKEVFPTPDQTVILLDTTMAFGTGSHDTTKLCLEFISELAAKDCPQSLLDVGCGSGVLSIAARKLGVREVVGIDISDAIIETARKNAQKNSTAEILLSTTPVAKITKQFELVVANIISSVLLQQLSAIKGCVSPGGKLILSGILQSELDDFLIDLQMETEEIRVSGEWVALLIQR